MKIQSMRSYLVALPPRRVHNWASKMDAPIGRHFILRLETDDGLVGYGEAPALATWGGAHGSYYGETPETVQHIVSSYLFPALEGVDPSQLRLCHARMDRAVKGHPYAKCAVDLALYDLAGKAAGVPVYELLGGKLRDSIPICHSLGIMDNDAAVREAKVAVEDGARTIKCKTGLDRERDVALVRLLRQELGGDVAIRVDANEGYRTANEAVQVTNEMADSRILFHEQPVMGMEAMAEVAKRIPVPVMADESAWTPRDILRLWQLGAAQIISLYYSKPGGLGPAMQVATVAEACDFTCDIGGSIELGIGVAANLQLGVSVPILGWASVVPVPNVGGERGEHLFGTYYRDDIIREPLRLEQGELFVPDRAGLGVEVDEEKLERYAC